MSAYNHALETGRRKTCEWSGPLMSIDMACGALGGGTFIAAVISGWLPCAIAGFILAAAVKGIILLADLPNLQRMPLVFLRPKNSLISIGGIAL